MNPILNKLFQDEHPCNYRADQEIDVWTHLKLLAPNLNHLKFFHAIELAFFRTSEFSVTCTQIYPNRNIPGIIPVVLNILGEGID